MDELSEVAFRQYRSLVEKPEFITYFHEATPIDHIDALNIGSRPSRRKATQDISDLRAIPWVFAWTQTRVNLPSWYGVGSALETWVAATAMPRSVWRISARCTGTGPFSAPCSITCRWA